MRKDLDLRTEVLRYPEPESSARREYVKREGVDATWQYLESNGGFWRVMLLPNWPMRLDANGQLVPRFRMMGPVDDRRVSPAIRGESFHVSVADKRSIKQHGATLEEYEWLDEIKRHFSEGGEGQVSCAVRFNEVKDNYVAALKYKNDQWMGPSWVTAVVEDEHGNPVLDSEGFGTAVNPVSRRSSSSAAGCSPASGQPAFRTTS